jgi:hypothetical protein
VILRKSHFAPCMHALVSHAARRSPELLGLVSFELRLGVNLLPLADGMCVRSKVRTVMSLAVPLGFDAIRCLRAAGGWGAQISSREEPFTVVASRFAKARPANRFRQVAGGQRGSRRGAF